MGGKRSQRKGAAGERELAAIFQEHGYNCTRGGSLFMGGAQSVWPPWYTHRGQASGLAETLRQPKWIA